MDKRKPASAYNAAPSTTAVAIVGGIKIPAEILLDDSDPHGRQRLEQARDFSQRSCEHYQQSLVHLRVAKNEHLAGERCYAEAYLRFTAVPHAGGSALLERNALARERAAYLVQRATVLQEALREMSQTLRTGTDPIKDGLSR